MHTLDLSFYCFVFIMHQVRGFSIEYLAKVPEVKDTVHKHSILHHLCTIILEQFPDSSDLYSDIGPITRCSRVSVNDQIVQLHVDTSYDVYIISVSVLTHFYTKEKNFIFSNLEEEEIQKRYADQKVMVINTLKSWLALSGEQDCGFLKFRPPH